MKNPPVRISALRASRRSAYPRVTNLRLRSRAGPVITTSSQLPSGFQFTPVATASFSTSSTKMESQPKKNLSSLESYLTPTLFKEIRDFWYEHLDSDDNLCLPTMEHSKRWFMGGKELDDMCIERFAPTLEAIRSAGATTAHDILTIAQPRQPLDWLSLILLFDQMPRNCYRGPDASLVFTVFDPIALQLAVTAIEKGIPEQTPEIRWHFAYRNWFFLPLMHSEEKLFHDRALEHYERMQSDIMALAEEEGDVPADSDKFRKKAKGVVKRDVKAAKTYADLNVEFEKKHADIIKQFGRYPHRNAALGRTPTKEEEEYLANGGETFSAPK